MRVYVSSTQSRVNERTANAEERLRREETGVRVVGVLKFQILRTRLLVEADMKESAT